MISKRQMDAIRLPAFYVEGRPFGLAAAPLRNANYGRAFPAADGPLERLIERGRFAEAHLAAGPEDLEEAFPERGETRWWRVSLVPVGPAGRPPAGVFGLCIDVTASKMRELALASAVYEDGLTGVSNRRRFDLDLAEAMARATTAGASFSVLIADIDRFKAINDQHGHQTGDAALKAVAGALQAALRRGDRVYRIGGDEFAALIGTGEAETLASITRRIKAEIDRLPALARMRITVSVGGTVWSKGQSALDVLMQADMDMYEQKASLRSLRLASG